MVGLDVSQATAGFKALSAQMGQAAAGFKATQGGADQAGASSAAMNTKVGKATGGLGGFGGAIGRVAGQLKNTLSRGLKSVGDDLEATTKSFRGAGLAAAGMAAAAGYELKEGISDVADYREQLNLLGYAWQLNADQQDAVGKAALRAGYNQKYALSTANDYVKATLALQQANVGYADAMDGATDAALALQNATKMDSGAAGAAIGTFLHGYGLPGSKAPQASDVYANLAAKFGSSPEESSEFFKLTVQQAKAANVGPEQLGGFAGLLARNNQKGSFGGTAFRNVLSTLQNPTEQTMGALGALGTKAYDGQGKLRDVPTILKEINAQRANMVPAAYNKALEQLFGAETSQVRILIEQSAELDTVTASVNKLGGAQELAGARARGLGGAWRGLLAIWATARAVAIDPFADWLAGVVGGLAEMVKWLSETNPWVIRFAVGAMAALAVIVPLALAIAGLVAVFGSGVGEIILVGLAIAAVGGVAAAIIPELGNLGGVVGWVGGLFAGLGSLIGDTFALLPRLAGTSVAELVATILRAWAKADPMVGGLLELVRAARRGVDKLNFKVTAAGTDDTSKGFLSQFAKDNPLLSATIGIAATSLGLGLVWDLLTGKTDVAKIKADVSATLSGAWDWIQWLAGQAGQALSITWSTAIDLAGRGWAWVQWLNEQLGSPAQVVWSTLVDLAGRGWAWVQWLNEQMGNPAKTVWETLTTVAGNGWAWVQWIAGQFGSAASVVWETLTTAAGYGWAWVQWLNTQMGNPAGVVWDTLTTVAGRGWAWVQWLNEQMGNPAQVVWGTLVDLVGNGWTWVQWIATEAAKFVPKLSVHLELGHVDDWLRWVLDKLKAGAATLSIGLGGNGSAAAAAPAQPAPQPGVMITGPDGNGNYEYRYPDGHVDIVRGFRANGGGVDAGKPYLVGERGPELMVPGTGGSVVSNDRLLGGGGRTINLHLYGNVYPSNLQDLVVQAIDEADRRGRN